MPKIYLLGGENIYKQDARQVNQRAFEDAGDMPDVLVFSWARASFDKKYKTQKTLLDYFKMLGANTINIVDYSDSPQNIAEKLEDTSLVYLTGGVPSLLLERLQKTGIDQLLAQYNGVIVGRSAGALALCRKCVITYRSSHAIKLIEGLGLVDLTLKAHYTAQNDKSLMAVSNGEKIYAAPKGSAIIYDRGTLSFIGDIFLFQEGIKQKIN